jgi:hypothetical protein
MEQSVYVSQQVRRRTGQKQVPVTEQSVVAAIEEAFADVPYPGDDRVKGGDYDCRRKRTPAATSVEDFVADIGVTFLPMSYV